MIFVYAHSQAKWHPIESKPFPSLTIGQRDSRQNCANRQAIAQGLASNSILHTQSVWTIEKLERIEKALGILPK
jgi:hypothetical protein